MMGLDSSIRESAATSLIDEANLKTGLYWCGLWADFAKKAPLLVFALMQQNIG